MVQPVGTVQTYELAVATDAIEYVLPVLPEQAMVLPVIGPGAPGIDTTGVTERVVAELFPQSF